MAARLLGLPEPGVLPPIPNRDDDLESFWHVSLWTALKHCQHKLSLVDTQSQLRVLFDSSYTDPLSGLKGGSFKQSELGSQTTIQQMWLGSKAIETILIDVATVLYTRYPKSDGREMGVAQVETIWKMIQSENPHLPESDWGKLLRSRIALIYDKQRSMIAQLLGMLAVPIPCIKFLVKNGARKDSPVKLVIWRVTTASAKSAPDY